MTQEDFLKCFPGYWIQTLDDKAARGADTPRQALPELVKDGPSSAFTENQLRELNEKGAGIFFSPNQFSQRRKKEQCEGVNAYFMEMDGISKEEQWKKILNSPLNPSVIVESRNSYQVHWLVSDGTTGNWDRIIRGIIAHFGADPACKDISRVLRIPGFYHNKKEPFLVKIEHADYEVKYTENEMLEAFTYSEETPPKRVHQPITEGLSFWEAASHLDNKTMLQKLSGLYLVNHEHFSFRPRSSGGEYIDVNGQPADAWLDQGGMIGSGKHGGPTWIQWVGYYGWHKRDIAKWLKEKCSDLLPATALNHQKNDTNEAKTTQAKYDFTHIGDLLNEPEENIAWIVDGMLPSGGFSLLIAKPKVGKSTIARQLALSVSRGEEFLGRSTAQGRVLYVSLEEKRQEVRKHFKLMGAEGNEDLGIYVGSTPEDAHRWLESEVKKQHPVLVIIDTLFRFARVTDLNDYAKTLVALDPLLALARTHGAHVMGAHHARKSPGDGADSTLGSTAIFGSVDTAIILKRTEGKRTIETQQRYGEDMEPTVLVFNSETKMTTLGGTKEEEDLRKIEFAILEFLRPIDKSVEESVIDAEVEGKTGLRRRALRNLVSRGEVIRAGLGKKGDPYQYSCFLVPSICVEQEKRISDSVEEVHKKGINSRSEELTDSAESGNEKRDGIPSS